MSMISNREREGSLNPLTLCPISRRLSRDLAAFRPSLRPLPLYSQLREPALRPLRSLVERTRILVEPSSFSKKITAHAIFSTAQSAQVCLNSNKKRNKRTAGDGKPPGTMWVIRRIFKECLSCLDEGSITQRCMSINVWWYVYLILIFG